MNIWHDFPTFERLEQRLELIAGEIRRLKADIVCLQEVMWNWRIGSSVERLAERTGLNHVYVRANGNRNVIVFEEGLAILSRYPLRDVSFKELKPQARPFEHRVVLRAVASTARGELSIYTTHLTFQPQAVNLAQMAALKSYVEQTSRGFTIVAGDLNASERSPQIASLNEAWLDTFRFINSQDPGFTCCVHNPLSRTHDGLGKRLDYIFVSAPDALAIEIKNSKRILDKPIKHEDGWLWASNHTGIFTEILFRAQKSEFSD